ncbi:MAG: (Fe-S)-binding protein [Bacteroidales bacterium]|nr:(Fe-S)-binding protein [Bacteroidales bacterium]
MDIELFIPCFIDKIYPNTAWNSKLLLEKAGCTVHYNPKQTCCGQPAYNSGYLKNTKKVAKKFIDSFKTNMPVVGPSGSCTGFVKRHYFKIFKDDVDINSKAIDFSNRVFEITDFLVNHLQFTQFDAYFPHRVTFHDSCSALREYGIKLEPRTLLNEVEGLSLIEMKDSETCCGFGGTFSAKFDGIASAMTQQKVENAINTGAEYIVGTEASCLMNIQAYIDKYQLPIRTIHIVDVLAQTKNKVH